jgi:endonuclease III
MIQILSDQTTHEQLINRVRSLARELAEAKAALAAAETRENVLIDRIREGL